MAKELAQATTGEIDRTIAKLDVAGAGIPEHIDDAPTVRMLPFANRFTAGRTLGKVLAQYTRTQAVVLGIAPGGLAVADGVADELGLPLDVVFTRKVRAPSLPALVIGVVAERWALVVDREAVTRANLQPEQIRALARATAAEIDIESRRHRGRRAPLDLRGKTVILCDDGIVTGGTLCAAADGARRRGAVKIVVASPVGSRAAITDLQRDVEEVTCLITPQRMRRVGAWYSDYRQVTETSVSKILGRSNAAA
jgi:putative phosphoribosyl transferase